MKYFLAIILYLALATAGVLAFYTITSKDLALFRNASISRIRYATTIVFSPSASLFPSPTHTVTPTATLSSSPAPSISNNGAALVSLNFDDGYKSTYKNGIPILNSLGLKSTQYIITGRFNDPEYVSPGEILDMEAHGHEIGAHTRTHPHLTQLSEDQIRNEVVGSKQDLLDIGVKVVSTFAYPYGDHNAIVAHIARGAFSTVRTTNSGFDDAHSDRYSLVSYSVNADTPLSQVQTLIDEAIQQKKWLILVFHRVDENGNPISVTHQTLQQIGQYIIAHHVPVVTMKEGTRITFGK